MAADRKYDISTGRFINRISGEEIPADEPVFVFRGRDLYAIEVLAFYQGRVKNPHHQRAVQGALDAFVAFSLDHAEQMREPGTTRHVRPKGEQP